MNRGGVTKYIYVSAVFKYFLLNYISVNALGVVVTFSLEKSKGFFTFEFYNFITKNKLTRRSSHNISY